ncbi:MAG TPA: hypothetical protein PKY95_07465 [candidate division Zixibacteria bacterium]|nr:hypothetical protein [candidate division Zixibacteria bacterium]
MVPAKTLAVFLAGAVLIPAALPGGAAAAGESWTTLTSFKTVRAFAVVGDTLYAATPGGLLLIADSSSPGRAYLHADGLGTNDLEDVLVDDGDSVAGGSRAPHPV